MKIIIIISINSLLLLFLINQINSSKLKDAVTKIKVEYNNKYKEDAHELARSVINKTRTKVRQRAADIAQSLNERLEKLDLKKLADVIPFFNNFMKIFGKKYSNEAEEKSHMGYFMSTLSKIREHNKNKNVTYTQGINDMTDMNYTEIKAQRTGLLVTPEEASPEQDVMVKASEPVPEVEDLPPEWDWRKYGVLTIPRSQGKCGSCWSFAAAAVLESHNMKLQIAEGKFDSSKQITVSEQNLIDCSAEKFGSIGCDGGMPQQAFKYVKENNGVDRVEDYPYEGKLAKCRYDESKKSGAIVDGQKRLKTGEDKDLVTAIYNYGPVAIAVHVTKAMASYKNGIFDDPTCEAKKVNHAVVAVGYSPEYFIVRNSWGAKWGEEGYIKISRKVNNNCGVSQQGYYPLIPNAVDTSNMKDKLKEI